ncbi:uromodulin-like [Bufo gargarizans]|uniref:uromodulin-like n=1 Tax=Bufo gargarizans TaxID=30331 RepID=UPI001CF5E0B9|nr:uromodulin-like [Bufo gargarizans]
MIPLNPCWWSVAVLGLLAVISAELVNEANTPMVHIFYKDPWPQEQSTVPASSAEPSACANVCENGGQCQMLQGEPLCVCEPGFMGDACQDLQLQLSCDSDRMTIGILKSVLQELAMNLSVLHLSNPECKLLNTSGLHFSITLTHENHSLCGTTIQVNGSHLTFSNELSARTVEERAELPSTLITRSSGFQIVFSCVYRHDQVVSLPFPLLTVAALVTFTVREGKFNVSMNLYPTAEYAIPYYSPPVIPLNQRMYVQLQIQGPGPETFFILKLEECWATPWESHEGAVRHLLITDGAANDSTVDMTASGNRSLSRFSLKMFRFISYRKVYLHCRIWLCPYNETLCQQQPLPGRQKRDLSDPYRKVVTCGPIQLAEGVRSSVEDPESGLGALVLPGSLAAGAVLLLLGSVAFAKAFKKMTGRQKYNNPAHVTSGH